MVQYTKDIDGLFFTKLDDIAGELGARPLDMLRVMYSESGCSATAWNDNPKHLPPEQRWNASGLIQFMPATMKLLGWTKGHAAFRQLTATQQLDFVRKYYVPYTGKLGSVGALYTATFLPALTGKAGDPSFVLTAKNGPLGWAYAPNAVFDVNRDYAITVGELEDAVRRNCRGARWDELVARLDVRDDNPTTAPAVRFDTRTTIGLQQALAHLGFPAGALDGIPGPRTTNAVLTFQRTHGLTPDGIFGPASRAALEAALRSPSPPEAA